MWAVFCALLPQLSQTQLRWHLVFSTGYWFRGIFFIFYISIREGNRSKVQRFKGWFLITVHHFLNALYGKTDRFHIPTNLEHGIWQLCGKSSIFYEDFGSSILSLSLTRNPAFSGKPCRRSRLMRNGSGEPVNAYDMKHLKTSTK